MNQATLFYNATLYTEDGPRERGWLTIEEGRIAALGQGTPPSVPRAVPLDLRGLLLLPGLIDLHVHGALGYDTMDATPEALQQMARFYASHGVTGFLATTMSNPPGAILAALRNVAEVMRQGTRGAALLGAHVEGPYLDVERRGCQDPANVRPADPDEYTRLFATGTIKLLTVAPELPGSPELIAYARERGAAIAAGHSRASYDEMCRAADLGLTQVTHLFNGMDPLHHRQPGVVGAALSLDALSCQLIADNIHVHPAVLKLAVRAKGVERILLITDAMSGTGMPDGQYNLGGLAVTVREGVARTADGVLAGSTLTLERGLRNIIAATDLSLQEALPMAARNAARALGLEAHKGSLAPGRDADLIVVDDRLNILLTVVAGEIVYQGSHFPIPS